MVRLRSNRWYAADGQRSRQRVAAMQSSGTRRVMSLCILLALVMLLMQRAADPRHVRHAFQALGVPLDPAAPPAALATASGIELPTGTQTSGQQVTLRTSDPASQLPSAQGSPSSVWQTTCADVIPRILDSLTAVQLHSLTEFWFSRAAGEVSQGGPPLESPSDLPETNIAEVDTDKRDLAGEWAEQGRVVTQTLAEQTRQSNLSSDAQEQWLAQLQTFSTQWQTLCTTPASDNLPVAVSPELQHALTTILDQRLLAGLRDAAPWTQSEALAFWRLLQRTAILRTSAATLPPAATAPLVSMLQLDAEARNLRGQRLRFRGGVRRVERVDRAYAPLHMQAGYWVLWLRGEDDAPQPVAVYTTDPTADQLIAQISDRDAEYPHIEVQGIFGKRVAYASPAGLQVGPALFASRLVAMPSGTPPLAVASPEQLRSDFRLAVAVAGLLAALVVLPILWRNRRRSTASQGKAGGSQRWGLLLLSTTAGAGLVASQPQPARAAAPTVTAQSPPWATATPQPLREFLHAAGVTPLSHSAADAVRTAARDRSVEFPSGLLKTIHAIRRVGWGDAPHTLEPIDLGGGLTLQGRALSGWVRAATPVVLDETQRAWFQSDEQPQLYRLEVQAQVAPPGSAAASTVASVLSSSAASDPASELLTIYCERVPQMWLSTAQLRQPAQFSALAIIDSTAAAKPILCALAATPQWVLRGSVPIDTPTSELASHLAPPLPTYLLHLGQLGWDLSYLDIITQRTQQPLSRAEAAGFYSMLRLSRTASSAVPVATDSSKGDSPAAPADGVDAAAAQAMDLLASARESVGKPLRWRVRIVTGTLVRVAGAKDQQDLGGQAYIQYDGFVDIGRQRIRFQPAELASATAQSSSPGPAPPLEFSGEYPVTIVAPAGTAWELGQPPLAGQESWPVGQYAMVQGLFYRLWSYQSELVKSRSTQARQIAPLIVATQLTPTTPPKRDAAANVGWFGWAMSAAMITILAAILWSATRKKRSLPA